MPMKRLTIDVPASLYARIKAGCNLHGRKIVDKVRELLDRHFPRDLLEMRLERMVPAFGIPGDA